MGSPLPVALFRTNNPLSHVKSGRVGVNANTKIKTVWPKTMEALDLTSAPFAHGRLHVPVGCVQKRDNIKLCISLLQCGEDDKGADVTTIKRVECASMEAAMP